MSRVRIRFVCPHCGHGVELNVLEPPKWAPECACRPGRVTTTMQPEQVCDSPGRLLETSGPSDASTSPARDPAPTEEAPDMAHGTRSAAKRKARA